MNQPQILVIIGSTRPVRIGDQLASVVADAVNASSSATATVEDLAVRRLPLLDEPGAAAMGSYMHAHTKEWAQTVQAADAVVFITPEYNAGYPAALKNAIDYLYNEWAGKPALIVSYGSHGGGRVHNQLSEVARSLKMELTETKVQVSFGRADFDSSGRLADPVRTFAPQSNELQEAIAELVSLATHLNHGVTRLPAA